ncbi:MAG TPA: outer membrane beta-barrel protein, partial [Chitinophagaceae bacterium]|nr:outer membrane beta-barrel protein [Chitinophagaceae bacterium]
VQRKFFHKKLTLTANIIDPFVQQNRNYTYGTNFILQSFSTVQTRNFRLSLGYNFTKTPKKPVSKAKK